MPQDDLDDEFFNSMRKEGLTQDNINLVRANSQYIFDVSCYSGYEDLAHFMYDLAKVDSSFHLDVNTDFDHAFRWSCENGHTNIAQCYIICLKMIGV